MNHSPERTYTTVDKSEWGAGCWSIEPDKIQWIDEATDLDCLIVRNRMGSLCGYVGVPGGHAAYGSNYDDLNIEVHGGLTYADSCEEDVPEHRGICHVPFLGRPADIWWIGFDTGHYMDYMPAHQAELYKAGICDELASPDGVKGVYRDIDYVRSEVKKLARQLADCGGLK